MNSTLKKREVDWMEINKNVQDAGAGLLNENARRTRIMTNFDIVDWFFSKAFTIVAVAGIAYLFFQVMALVAPFGVHPNW
ncbi:MAG: hypothetical protein PHS06_01670 [Candidatus Shapirobacteria bacterium]|nr:hypothetical protein [Candidatus Shapirobacteria bacterium]